MSSTKLEKRRGRPPKNMVVTQPIRTKPTKKEPEEEQLVLYLPNFDDEPSEKKSMCLTKDNTDDTENKFISSESDSDHVKFKHLTDKHDSESNDSNDKKNYNINIEKLLDELHKRDVIINTLRTKIKDKNIFNDNTITLTKENKKHLINLGLININGNKINICEKTNISCWWCTYSFDTQPLFIPDHYKNNIYHVFGNFCSFACMLAYNENMDDYRKSVRTSLIKQLYCEIFNCDYMNIKSAPPREILEKFGGPMNISKYRDSNVIGTKIIKLTMPPVLPLIVDYEEVVINKN